MLKRHRKKIITMVTLFGVAIYLFWSGFSVPLPDDPTHDIIQESLGEKSGAMANIVSIAPVMQPTDYASAEHFKKRLAYYFEVAFSNGWLTENTIVLLPAHIGTPLLAAEQKSRVYGADTIGKIVSMLMIDQPVDFAKNYFIFDAKHPWLAAAARTNSKRAAEIYRLVFSGLAQNYGVTIVAGSIVLMTPGIYPDGLTYGHGPLFHTSFVFGPDGSAQVDAIRQVTPSPFEAKLVKASLPEFLPAFDHGDMRFAVAIGADAENAAVLDYFKQSGVDIILSPRALPSIRGAKTQTPLAGDMNFSRFSATMGLTGWGYSAAASTAYRHKDRIGSSTTGTSAAIIENMWISSEN